MQYSKKGMSTIIWTLIIVVVAAVVAIAVFGPGKASSNTVANTQNTQNSQQSSQQTSSNQGTKLSDSQYANAAYLISTDTLSADAQTAITGFNIQKTSNSDGSTTYNLIAINPEYQTQSYTIQPGQSLYFIENNLGDDSTGAENFPGDDMAIVVDANGFIVSGPGPA